MKRFAKIASLIAFAASASSALATTVTVTPDITNRITIVTPDTNNPTRANSVFTNFSTWQSDSGTTNTQRTLQITSTATIIIALEAELGPLGFGESYQISSAILTVGSVADAYTDIATAHQLLNLYPTNPTWNSFNNGGVAGVDYDGTASATSVAGTNSASWDLTAVVQGWVAGGTNNGLYFKSVGNTTGASTFTTITGTWTLQAQVIPEPGVPAMLGAFGLLNMWRRRRN